MLLIPTRQFLFSVELIKNVSRFKKLFSVNYSQKSLIMDDKTCLQLTRQLAPPLNNAKYKGQAGRIGVFGGSLEYTGAPYFSSISSLKVGADLSHVFCTKEAAPVIKSYSPELIVHPLLDAPSASSKIEPWLDRLHVILIGPGLGREPATFQVIEEVMALCRAKLKPLVIDADGLFLISQKPDLLRDYPSPVILTPNIIEFARLLKSEKPVEGDKKTLAADFLALSPNINILCKGHDDEIFNSGHHASVTQGGSGRRCGGQGDLLGGAVSTFLAWALQQLDAPTSGPDHRPIVAGYAACTLARACNRAGFVKKGRSMTCSDMIQEIHGVFEEYFEVK